MKFFSNYKAHESNVSILRGIKLILGNNLHTGENSKQSKEEMASIKDNQLELKEQSISNSYLGILKFIGEDPDRQGINYKFIKINYLFFKNYLFLQILQG